MPKTNNVITAGWKGTFGREVVFRQVNGQTITSSYPDMSKRVLTSAQLKINELMKKANRHISAILADEQSRSEAQVRLDVPRNKLYHALVREYYSNHYKSENQHAQAESANPEPHEIPGTQVNFDFMKFLLENTSKSVEEISKMTKMSAEVISVYQEKYRKSEESDEELINKFKAGRP